MEYILDAYWLNFAIATGLPMLVALITKKAAAGHVKALTLLALSAVNGALVSIQATGGVFRPSVILPATIVSFVTSVGVHYGLLKPSGVTGSDGVLAEHGLQDSESNEDSE